VRQYGDLPVLHAERRLAPPELPVRDEQRQARFVCAMALALPSADLAIMVDEVHGVLLRSARGTNGFGYDPLFYFPEFNKTTAELDMATKSGISHRGKALRRILSWMSTQPSLGELGA